MFRGNVTAEVWFANGLYQRTTAKNTILEAGLNRMARAMIDPDYILGSDMSIYGDSAKLGDMDTGYPLTASSSGRNAQWRVTRRVTADFAPTTFYIADDTGSDTVNLLSVTRASLNVPALRNGDQLRLTWELTLAMDSTVQATLIPGAGTETAATATINAARRGLVNRIVSDTSQNGAATIEFYQSPRSDDRLRSSNPLLAEAWNIDGSSPRLTTTMSYSAGKLVSAEWTLPAISNTEHPSQGNKWGTLRLGLHLVSVFYEEFNAPVRAAVSGRTIDIQFTSG